MKRHNKLSSLFLVFGIFFCSYQFFCTINQPASATGATRKITNIGIMIRFANSDQISTYHIDSDDNIRNVSQLLNSNEPVTMETSAGTAQVPSVKKYYETQSYSKLSIETQLFPSAGQQIIAYQDPQPFEYYQPKSDSNPLGYADNAESLQRELQLLENAINHISNQVATAGLTANDLDTNHDGKIDAVSLFIEGKDNYRPGFQSLLWSHERVNNKTNISLLNTPVGAYTVIYCSDYTGTFSLNNGGYGTIIHELGHTLGFQDLYRYGNGTLSLGRPVGFYDIMANSSTDNPANFLAYFASAQGWRDSLPVIKQTTGNITLSKAQFTDPSEKNAIRVQPSDSDEYFIIEYYSKQQTLASATADASGLIVYRVNESYHHSVDPSNAGTLDHIFIFRPGENKLGDGFGNLTQATLNQNRPSLGKPLSSNTAFDGQTIYYSNGSNSGITIDVIKEDVNSITFNLGLPEVEGDGTKNHPYLINNIEQFFYLLQNDTVGKYYLLTANLDFSGRNYPAIDFKGHFDGNNKTISNISAVGTGVFRTIGDPTLATTVQNLQVENLTVTSTGSSVGGSLGGLAISLESNSIVKNVHLLSGNVTNTASINGAAATGGFIGNANGNSTIEDCSCAIDVTAPRNVGGFIGLNLNATMVNVVAAGKVTGEVNVGGFIGAQAINSAYKIPQNASYNSTNQPTAVGGYLESFHNTDYLPNNELGIGINGISSDNLNEIIILNRLGLQLHERYLTGFNPKSQIEDVKNLFNTIANISVADFYDTNEQIVTNGQIGTGIKFSVINGDEIYQYTIVIKGDTNGDGEIYATDYVRIRNHIMGKAQLTGAYLYAADINDDGKIHATDYVRVRNHIMGKTLIEQK